MWRNSVVRLPVTAAKYITKSSLFILLPGVIRQPELMPISEQKAEDIFVQPPYSQAACCRQAFSLLVLSNIVFYTNACQKLYTVYVLSDQIAFL
jgi:hypothetical protein